MTAAFVAAKLWIVWAMVKIYPPVA